MNFANVGLSGLLLIVIVLVLVFGPSKLPELGKAFGRSLKEFREATRGISEDIAGTIREETRPVAVKAESAQPSVSAAAVVEPIELQNPKDR